MSENSHFFELLARFLCQKLVEKVGLQFFKGQSCFRNSVAVNPPFNFFHNSRRRGLVLSELFNCNFLHLGLSRADLINKFINKLLFI
jgi:hypothetical protein